MLCMELDQSLLFLKGPLVSLYATLEMIMVTLPTLLAVPSHNVVVGLHQARDFAPFIYSFDFK